MKKTKIQKEKSESYLLPMAFLATESDNRQLEDLLQADFGSVPERFLLSVWTKSIIENFVYRLFL